MKVTAIIRKDQPDKNGLCKIYIRVHDKEKRKFLPTTIRVLPSQFEKGKIKNHKQAALLNKKLFDQISDVELLPVTRYDSFEQFAKKFIEQNRPIRSTATISYYERELKRFTDFAGNVSLKEVSTDLLRNYRAQLKLHPNTIWKTLKFVRTILNHAINEGILQANAVRPLKIKYHQGTRDFLTQEEVSKIVTVSKEPGPLQKVAQWFLFQCYTGLAIADLQRVDVVKILAEGRITMSRKKTGNQFSVPLLPEAKQILIDTPPLNLSSQNYNLQLKSLSTLAGIKKKMTSHLARHTFGMRLAELKISKEVAMKLLGHTRMATTDVYYKILDKRVEEEFRNFNF